MDAQWSFAKTNAFVLFDKDLVGLKKRTDSAALQPNFLGWRASKIPKS